MKGGVYMLEEEKEARLEEMTVFLQRRNLAYPVRTACAEAEHAAPEAAQQQHPGAGLPGAGDCLRVQEAGGQSVNPRREWKKA